MKVLVTGGAGFIGSHVVRRLLQQNCTVTVLDNFSPQIHGGSCSLPDDVASHVQLHRGDVRSESDFTTALQGQESVIHLAAETGTGQSMYEVLRYQEVNVGGSAVLLQCVAKSKSIRTVVLASSRAVYGEGRYRCPQHQTVYPGSRRVSDMRAGRFEPLCPECGAVCQAEATPEEAPLRPASFYGLTKQMQEQSIEFWARTMGFSFIGLRYQNVFGPGQSLKNPYTGILAIFSNLARRNEPINIFEDGAESRDFVYIDDVVEATCRCALAPPAANTLFNVGSGKRVTVSAVVKAITGYFDSRSSVFVSGAFREGDIRHNFADISRIGRMIGFHPRWSFEDGLRQFLAWAESQPALESGYQNSLKEMAARGLYHE